MVTVQPRIVHIAAKSVRIRKSGQRIQPVYTPFRSVLSKRHWRLLRTAEGELKTGRIL